MQKQRTRDAKHAGSWYTDDQKELGNELKTYLNSAQTMINGMKQLKSLIVPHAGYAYSGPTAGWGYKELFDQQKNRTKQLKVFLLGPSHKIYFTECALSSMSNYMTPFGPLEIDQQIMQELKNNDIIQFVETNKKQEENEHSLEMHLPFIKLHALVNQVDIKLVPIMVGSTSNKSEELYGKLFAKYFDRDDTVFIISSDFCHWGRNFDYYPYDQSKGQVFQSIEAMDKEGIRLIEQHNTQQFYRYLDQTQNTICGRHPIGILLNIIQNSQLNQSLKTQSVKYAQSNQAMSKKDSSVSYASLITYIC